MVTIFNNKEEIAKHAADRFVTAATTAIAQRGKFIVALTGGSSPVGMYRLLATDEYQAKVNWEKVFVFWGDERWVPLADEKSNAKMSADALLNHVPIPHSNVFPMYSEKLRPEDAATEYENTIKNITGGNGVFDLILLGMGDDAHTASLFPGETVLEEKTKWVCAHYLKSQEMFRITLTAPLINKAREIIVITFGVQKATALHSVLKGAYDPEKYPTQLIQPQNGTLSFLVDEAAASLSNY